MSQVPAGRNPFFETWDTPFGIAPFSSIEARHFHPAFERAFAEHNESVAAITSDPAEPNFINTIAALEQSDAALRRVNSVFWNLVGADTNEELQAIEREIAPLLARHRNAILTNAELFARVEAVFEKRDKLSPEEKRVLQLMYDDFVRAGARLDGGKKARLSDIVERLALLGTQFSQNVLADENSYTLVLEGEEDLAGLPLPLRDAAARAAQDRGLPGKHVVTLARSSVEPFLQFSSRRHLRQQAYQAWIRRGENGGATDNRAIAAETVMLRAEKAQLLGFETFAHYKLDDAMAKTPDAVRSLLDQVWTRALVRANREREDLKAMSQQEGGNFEIAGHDWRYYAEKVRKAKHDLDEGGLKSYLQLDKIVAAAFHVAERLFGLTFTELHDVPIYHPEVRVFEARDREGRHVALFLGDYLARPSKRSGAWMSFFRSQEKLIEDTRPIVVNVMNFARGAHGWPTLLSFDDARTLFHEFGHALHGMLSDVTYPLIAGTNTPRDFVELPSQLYEHWFLQPRILRRFALHAETGEPIPDDLLARIEAARNFNQGFLTVEYCASAFVDLDLHSIEAPEAPDVEALERTALERIGMPGDIAMRHRTPHFTHVFSGDGYSAGYYSYLWSEVLDSDAFAAFEETGDPFDPATARRLYEYIYSAGSRRDPAEAYQLFRGQMPTIEKLLEKRGLTAAVSSKE